MGNILLWIVLGYGANHLIGCIVLAEADDENKQLFKWVYSAPYYLLSHLAVTLWPVTLYFWLTRK